MPVSRKLWKTCLSVLLLFGVVFPRPALAAKRPASPLAILGITSETQVLMTQLTEKREIDLLGVPFIMGKLKDTRVILARCGVGKVNAAMTATLLIDHFHPRGIVFTGSAGALNPDLAPGDVVIGVKTAQHDVGTLTAKGLAREPTDGISPRKQNPLFFPADPRLLNAATHSMAAVKLKEVAFGQEKRTPKIVKGVIVTGDVFVAERANNEELRRDLQADAVEEESAAVAQVCWEQRVPFLAIRSISDNANNETPVNYMRFYKLAAENSALLVTGIVMYLAKSPALP